MAELTFAGGILLFSSRNVLELGRRLENFGRYAIVVVRYGLVINCDVSVCNGKLGFRSYSLYLFFRRGASRF